ncbi:hypothetical protein JF50_13275 [Pseudoalteromonas luteoviolacea]|uniref:Uncharacterized protein n=1 Tax=Pseudoalteromonas luteoviolacea TaxID=43657 RepID=A0A0C1MQF9_9GAMM|nr:hypothetical protein [Pseudoalteromonas luteoviolacea]KID56863.1 hypothetical protein JF50_13275 [Pseudoalteromonas luteoviolacea]
MKLLSGIFALLAGALASNTQAIEPLPDRARVQHMNADLLLPDGRLMNVDVSFDCGSDYQDTAMMIMSDSGAKILAAAYTHLYGEQFGKQVMDAWNNKKHESDPRKPTYLFVIAPREQPVVWQNKYTNKVHKVLTRDTLGSYNGDSQDVSETSIDTFVPVLAAGCGTKIHNPHQVQ